MTVKFENEISPFMLEIIKDSLLFIGDEMFIALAKTSMSPMFYEALDYACGLTDAKGNLLSQGNGVTSFIGMLSPMVQHVIKQYNDGKDLNEGDVIIINDPFVGGGSHLSDVGLVMPIFYDGELIAFSVNKGHWTEIGGKDPGSFTNDSTEIYQEGLQLPGVKLFESGKINQAVVDIIEKNVRLPEQSLGDMWAQIAALRTGEKRFKELCSRYGVENVKKSIDFLLDQGRKTAKLALSKLPKGEFEATGYIEDDPEVGGPYPIKVKVTITDDKFICDFRGSHEQVTSPVNCSYYGLLASVRVIYLATIHPVKNINEGVFYPLEIITDEKSIVSAERPAPVSMNFEARLSGAELIWKALAPHIPDQLPAGHFLSVSSVLISGKHHDKDEPFLLVEPSVGGWGASNKEDGARGQFCMGDGETYNIPIEIAETRYGVMVEEYKFREDGGGAGKYIGGAGVIRKYRALTDGQKLSVSFGKHQFAPWGVNGGHDGKESYVKIIRKDGTTVGPVGVLRNYTLNEGDVVELATATGGGYGNPEERPKEQVKNDVRNGYITKEEAEEIYKVSIQQ